MAINEKEFLNNLNPEQAGAPKAGGRRLRIGFIGTAALHTPISAPISTSPM